MDNSKHILMAIVAGLLLFYGGIGGAIILMFIAGFVVAKSKGTGIKLPKLGRTATLVKKKKVTDKDALEALKEHAEHLIDDKDLLKVKVDSVKVDGVEYSVEEL